MIAGLVKIICELGIFIVCAQTVCCFRPKAVYEKYLKFLVGIMILLVLITPISSIFQKENSEYLTERLEEFYSEIEEGRRKALDLTEKISQEEDTEEIFIHEGKEKSVGGDFYDSEENCRIEENKDRTIEWPNTQMVPKISVERIEINENSGG